MNEVYIGMNEVYIVLGAIWVVGTLMLFVNYWTDPILKKRGDKIEHPNRTLARFVGNLFFAVIISASFLIWANVLIILSPFWIYRDRLDEYRKARNQNE